MAITISGNGITSANIADGTITTDDILASDVSSLKSGRKNLIINGAMQVAQRGTTSDTSGTDTYLLDRFSMSRFGGYPNNTTQTQESDAPPGFNKSFKFVRNNATTLSGTRATAFVYRFEGQDISHLNWGTSNAQDVTISFWVKSSLTGDFSFIMADSGNAYDIGKLYTISSANTWEKKTITIPAPTSGSFNTDNSAGAIMYFGFGAVDASRTAQGTTWGVSNSSGSSKSMVTGASTALATTSGATWQITGVQLELGSVATDFEHRSYGEELALCQRYYQQSYDIGTSAGTATYVGCFTNRTGSTTTSVYRNLTLPISMRTAPTITLYGTTAATNSAGKWRGSSDAAISMSVSYANHNSFNVSGNMNINYTFLSGHWVADAEL